MTTVFDAAGKGSAKASWALMRRARADRFESASSAAKPSPFQRDASCKIKKPDMYWSAPRGAVRPVISAVEIGYVRRSEIRMGANSSLRVRGDRRGDKYTWGLHRDGHFHPVRFSRLFT